ncbi:MAG: response regulator [Minisyncoccales bacterium]
MKILIVEDEDILRNVLQERFEEENFIVSIAQDGKIALSLAKKIKPDIILLDILLPKIDGIEVLTFLKADDDLSNIPVIMLSNLSEDQKIRQALELGAIDYLVKSQHPINEVVEKVNKYILKAK